MAEPFVALADRLRAQADGEREPIAIEASDVASRAPDVAAPPSPDLADFAGSLARARCRALEAYERAAERLLERLARDVLGRELRLERCDLSIIVERVRREFSGAEPVRLFVSAADAPDGGSLDLPLAVDPSLQAGDAVVEVRDGELDARLAVRFGLALDESQRALRAALRGEPE